MDAPQALLDGLGWRTESLPGAALGTPDKEADQARRKGLDIPLPSCICGLCESAGVRE